MLLKVAMTYSVELFICMIIGLVLGHGIFNTGERGNILKIIKLKYFPGAAVGESVDPCCASQAITNERNDSNNDEASIM